MPAPRRGSFLLGLDVTPSEVEDPKLQSEFIQIYKSMHQLAFYLDKYTGKLPVSSSDAPYVKDQETSVLADAHAIYRETNEIVLFGDLIYLASDGRVGKAQSVAGHGKVCRGIALNSAPSGGWVKVALSGLVNAYTGLVPGTQYALGTTAGALSASFPSTGSRTQQWVGYAVSTTTFNLLPELRYTTSAA